MADEVTPDAFGEKVQIANFRIDTLQEDAKISASPNAPLLPELFQELRIALEELQVAEEELRSQNETLIETRALVEQERQRYVNLFDFAPDGYLVTDKNGKITEANRAAGELFNLTPRYLVNKPIAVFIHESARAQFRSQLSLYQGRSSSAQIETVVRPRRRAAFPVSLNLNVIQDSSGRTTHIRWMVRDISDQKAFENLIVNSNAELSRRVKERTASLEDAFQQIQRESAITETLIATSPAPMGFTDTELRFIRVNESLARINGRSVKEHIGKRADEIIPPEHWQIVEPLCRRALSGEAIINAEVSGPKPTSPDEIGYYSCSFYPVQVGSETVGVGTIVRDITEFKKKEQAQAQDLKHTRLIADTLQMAMLQTVSEDAFPNLSVSTLYKAASDEALVGGDFFDAYIVDHGKVALVVGDVSGKGLTAATHTAEIKYALRAFLRETPNISLAMARLNEFICESQRLDGWGNQSLVVLALALINPQNGEVNYTSAGSEPLLVLPNQGDSASGNLSDTDIREYGRASGLVLGIQRQCVYQETTFSLSPGASILMTTDGITEARSGKAMLDLEGLKRLAAKAAKRQTVGEISRAILEGTQAFTGGTLTDDACLLLAQWHP